MAVALFIFSKIKEYLDDPQHFVPVRMTVVGAAGSGKTVLLKTMVTLIRKMFKSKRSALVCAPTGAAAFVSGGVTIQRMCGMNPSNEDCITIDSTKKDKLVEEFLDTIVLFLDERGMIGSKTLGKAERTIAQSTRAGVYADNGTWGCLPVVVLIGDDMQLPSVERGSFTLPLGPKKFQAKPPRSMLEACGQEMFLEAGQLVMVLGTIKRQDLDETDFAKALQGLRYDSVEDKDYQFLKQFHLQQQHWTEIKKAKISKKAMYAFSTNQEADNKNLEVLEQTSHATNPVAKCLCNYPTSKHNTKMGVAKHFNSNTPAGTLLCIGAQVMMAGKNFQPHWGLFNGAVGTVMEIVYEKGKDPHNGDLPSYVVCSFKGYNGPIWDKKNPTVSDLSTNMSMDCATLSCYRTLIPCF